MSRDGKQALALEIVAVQRQARMKRIAKDDDASLFEGDTVAAKMASPEAKWMAEGMGEKIAKVWAEHFSGRTLQQWKNEVLGTDIVTVATNLFDVVSEAADWDSSTDL